MPAPINTISAVSGLAGEVFKFIQKKEVALTTVNLYQRGATR
jgi:hypothetical protein